MRITKLVNQPQLEQEQRRNDNMPEPQYDDADDQLDLDVLLGKEQEPQRDNSQSEALDNQMKSSVKLRQAESKSQQKGKKPFQLKGRRGPNLMFHKREDGNSRPFTFKK